MTEDQYPLKILPYKFGVFDDETEEQRLTEKIRSQFLAGYSVSWLGREYRMSSQQINAHLGPLRTSHQRNAKPYKFDLQVGESKIFELMPVGDTKRNNRIKAIRVALRKWEDRHGHVLTHEVTKDRLIVTREQ